MRKKNAHCFNLNDEVLRNHRGFFNYKLSFKDFPLSYKGTFANKKKLIKCVPI